MSAIAGVTIGAGEPDAMRSRWGDLDLECAVRFTGAGPRGDGLDGVDLVTVDRDRAGETHDVGGVTFTLV